jgi:hypothetical protein
MKNSIINKSILFLALVLSLSSCSFIAGVFKTGMGVGIFLVVLLLIIVFAVVARAGKK